MNFYKPTIYDRDLIEQWRKARQVDPHLLRRLRHFLFREHRSVSESLRKGTDAVAESLQLAVDWQVLTITTRQDSIQDGSSKFVLQTRDQRRVEMVLMRARTGRTTVCVSSQVGCAAGCPFCATGQMGLTRSLTTAEILEQVRLAAEVTRSEQRQLRNVVFMGMGEPLDNETAVYEALDLLLDREWFSIPAHRIILSTVGVPEAMRRFVRRYPEVQFALSLHGANPDVRAKLIPWSRRHTWEELLDALRYVAEHHRVRPKQSPILIEYLMLQGVNDSDDDADALMTYLQGIPAHVNLIPYNLVADRPWQATPRARRDEFAKRLREAGFFTTVRYSMGNDIAAACGQLVTSDYEQSK